MRRVEVVILGNEVWLRVEYVDPAAGSLLVEYAKGIDLPAGPGAGLALAPAE